MEELELIFYAIVAIIAIAFMCGSLIILLFLAIKPEIDESENIRGECK